MEIGISTACLYPVETERSFEILANLGFRIFEIFVNTFSEVTPAYTEKLRKMAEDTGVKVVSLHPFSSAFESMLFFSEYDRRFRDGLEQYQRYFEMASRLGATIFVLHGQRDYQYGTLTEEEYLERYHTLYLCGKKHGVIVAQENVNRFRSENIDFIRRMRHALKDECAFVYDVKQAVRAGCDPYEMCAAMGDQIIHVHINDNNEKTDCVLPGRGTMDFCRIFSFLRQIKYKGDVLIEVYRSNFQEVEELLQAKQYMESVFCEEKQE